MIQCRAFPHPTTVRPTTTFQLHLGFTYFIARAALDACLSLLLRSLSSSSPTPLQSHHCFLTISSPFARPLPVIKQNQLQLQLQLQGRPLRPSCTHHLSSLKLWSHVTPLRFAPPDTTNRQPSTHQRAAPLTQFRGLYPGRTPDTTHRVPHRAFVAIEHQRHVVCDSSVKPLLSC